MLETVDKYWQLVADLESEVRRISGYYTDRLKCGPGCSDCCRPFAVFPVEAHIIRSAIKQNSEKCCGPGGERAGFCPLLRARYCTIYELRPLICRTQGLPIGYIDHEHALIEVSACELNFGDGDQFEVDRLLMMDTFNGRLREINVAFCKTNNIDPWQRISISEIAFL